MSKLQIETNADGELTHVLVGEWSAAMRQELERFETPHLVLNYAKGWIGNTVEFLGDCPPLGGLTILNWHLKDVTPVRDHRMLRSLNLSTYGTTDLDFSNFPMLERLLVYWNRGIRGLPDCIALKQLLINGFPNQDLQSIANLKSLERLWLVKGKLRSLNGIGLFRSLSRLKLGAFRNLSDVHAVAECSGLQKVEIQNCPNIKNFDALGTLANCEFLLVWDCKEIESLNFLKGMPNLEVLNLAGANEILDGNLSPVQSLSRLRDFKIRNRRTYSPSAEVVKAQVASRRT